MCAVLPLQACTKPRRCCCCLSPAGLRGELRLWRELPPQLRGVSLSRPTHQGCVIVCVGVQCVCSGAPHHLAGNCRLRQGASRGVLVSGYCICFCVIVGVGIGGLYVPGYPLHCCRGYRCLSLSGWFCVYRRVVLGGDRIWVGTGELSLRAREFFPLHLLVEGSCLVWSLVSWLECLCWRSGCGCVCAVMCLGVWGEGCYRGWSSSGLVFSICFYWVDGLG